MNKKIIVFITCPLILCGCFELLFPEVVCVRFDNDSDYKVCVWSMLVSSDDFPPRTIYPDTTLPCNLPPYMIELEPHKSRVVDLAIGNMVEVYSSWNSDTISFYVIDADTIERCGWHTVQEKYNILQRYDIGVGDSTVLMCLSFPPSEKMKHIKMWPPYGTYGIYDEHGQRIR